MYSRYVPNKLLIAHKSRLLFTYNDDSIRDKGDMSVSFTNYNYVGNTKISVSIKKLMSTNAHSAGYF